MNEQLTEEQPKPIQLYPFKYNKAQFSVDEAYSLVPLLINISKKAKAKVGNIQGEMSFYRGQKEKCMKLQLESNKIIQAWSEKIKRLGLSPVSLWKVRIPGNNNNAFIWEFPKSELQEI